MVYLDIFFSNQDLCSANLNEIDNVLVSEQLQDSDLPKNGCFEKEENIWKEPESRDWKSLFLIFHQHFLQGNHLSSFAQKSSN